MRLSVVLLQHNLSHLTRVALASVRDSERTPDEIIVVDNGSAFEQWRWLTGERDLFVTRLFKNVGYVQGTNVGWKSATGDVIVLCNNDIALSKQCIGRLERCLEEHPDLGWVSACYQEGGVLADTTPFPAEVRAEMEATEGRQRGSMNEWAETLMPTMDYVGVTEATVVAVRKAASDEVGYYWDELVYNHSHDYALRLRQAGWRVGVCRDAVFWHSVSHPTLRLVSEDGGVILHKESAESDVLMDERWGVGGWELEPYFETPLSSIPQ